MMVHTIWHFLCQSSLSRQNLDRCYAQRLTDLVRLHDMGAGPNMFNNYLPKAWKYNIKSIKSQKLQTVNSKVVHIEGTKPFPTHRGDPAVPTWLGTVKN